MFEFLDIKVSLISVALVAVYLYLKCYVYNYWKRHGVPHDSPSIPLGDIPFSYFFAFISLGNLLKKSYEKFCQHPFHGIYVLHKPVLVINDPELIRLTLVKEFNKFNDRGWFADEKVDPMSVNLFLQPFEKWKGLRGKFTPTFTPGKLRQIYPLMTEICNEMINACEVELKASDVMEMKNIIARYTTDIISSTVYGFNCNSLKDPSSELRRLGMKAFEFGRITMLMAVFFPEILKSITLPFYHKEVRDFFHKIFSESINHRRSEKVVRNDFLNLLIQLMDKGSVEDDVKSSAAGNQGKDNDLLSMADAAAQAFVFFLAGFETSSSTATYCLLELAMNPEIQEKLQREIDAVAKNKTDLTYDNIAEMEYLDMVFNETLRKYPAVVFLNRICTEDCPIPGSSFTIPKGMRIVISPPGLHHNPQYFPNPSKFDPDRFTKENLATRSPYVHMGFGEGPRNCIGKRFGILQTKLAIATLVRNYTFRVCDKTNLPLVFDTETFVQMPVHGVHMRIEKRRA